jgi:hypothetical protein
MNPFRNAGSSDYVPLAAMHKNRPVSASLLRGDSATPDTSATPLFAPGYTDAYRNSNRNAYFEYQGLQHLSNLVTTTSNVYAVWITVGYFEVHNRPYRAHPPVGLGSPTPWTDAEYAAVYPDGYALGDELGSDTGDLKRHRAFYIFDRSIPVGFQRGEDMNTGNCVLIKRFIE